MAMATLPYWLDMWSAAVQRWLFFWKVLLSPQRNTVALSEGLLGFWSPP